MLEQVGLTWCVMLDDMRALDSSLYVHGKKMATDSRKYQEDAAPLHGLRARHGWTQRTTDRSSSHRRIEMRAGDYATMNALAQWMNTSALAWTSQIASPLMQDLDRLAHWLRTYLWLRLFGDPTLLGVVGTLPWRCRVVLQIAGNFRLHALREPGSDWAQILPVIPLSGEEIDYLVKQQQLDDECIATRRLGEIESTSAAVILRMKLMRGVFKESLSSLRTNRRAQTNLLCILRGTRYRYYGPGALFPICFPNWHRAAGCGETDAFNRMLGCYALGNPLVTGPEAIGFWVLMAKRTLPKVLPILGQYTRRKTL